MSQELVYGPRLVLPALAIGNIETWKARLPLTEIMDKGIKDRRTFKGLRARLEKLEKAESEERPLWANFVSRVETAEQLQKSSLTQYSDNELFKMLSHMDLEGATLPTSLKAKVIQRYANHKLANKQWSKLVACMNPFEHTVWDNGAPAVSALDAAPETKLSTFESIYMRNVVIPLLSKGEAGQQDLVAFAEVVLQVLDIDPSNLDNLEAGYWKSASTVFGCIMALASEALDTSKEDPLHAYIQVGKVL
eukprot:6492140-Amphidinium_carterae.2